jgi:hypothetical protein
MTTDRRQDPRFSIEQIVEISFGREAFVRGSGINISKTGILCETDGYLEPSSQVSLQLTIQMGSEIHRFNCEGIVVRTDEAKGTFQSGISFTDLRAADARKLGLFLKQQKPAPKRK